MSTHEIYEELGGVWGRTGLNTQQLKLGLGSSDAPGPTLIENRGQIAKRVLPPTKPSTLFTAW